MAGVWEVTPYYQHAGVTLYHGNCEAVLPALPAEQRFDLVFTSPPYNLGGKRNHDLRTSRSRRLGRWNRAVAPLAEGYGQHGDDLDWAAYTEWQHRVLLLCWARLEPAGAIYYNHKPLLRGRRVRLPTDYNPGLPLRQIVIWDRGSGFNFERAHYCPRLEWIMVMAPAAFDLRDRAASKASDYWRIDFEQNTPHPAPFPPALPGRALDTTGARSLLDPYCGWGSSLVAARIHGVAAVGIEIEERFCEMAARRLDQGSLEYAEAAG